MDSIEKMNKLVYRQRVETKLQHQITNIKTLANYLKNDKATQAILSILKELEKVDIEEASLSELIFMENMLAKVPHELPSMTNESFNNAIKKDCTNPTPSGLFRYFKPYPLRDALEEMKNIVTDFKEDMGASIKKAL